MTELITAEDAIRTLRELVADLGVDFVYQPLAAVGACQYEHRGEPSCGVGKALARLGVPTETLTALDCGQDNAAESLHVSLPRVNPDFRITVAASDVFQGFQYPQDREARYGVCLEKAEARYSQWEGCDETT